MVFGSPSKSPWLMAVKGPPGGVLKFACPASDEAVCRTELDRLRSAKPLRERVTDRYFAWRATEDNSVLRLARKRLLASGSGAGQELDVKFSCTALQHGL